MTRIDHSILLALQQGSHSAFEKIFSFYFTKVQSFIQAYVKNMADAEELTEDVFVGLWHNHASINPEKSFDAYLHTIAKHKALNFLKRKQTSKTIIEVQSPANFAFSPEEEYIALKKALLIELIVEKMPVQRKHIYHLRQQGLSNNEIAKELATTKRNVESQISLALKEIRNAFQHYLIVFI